MVGLQRHGLLENRFAFGTPAGLSEDLREQNIDVGVGLQRAIRAERLLRLFEPVHLDVDERVLLDHFQVFRRELERPARTLERFVEACPLFSSCETRSRA